MKPAPASLPPFVSRQVKDAKYWFLNLKPPASAELAAVCGGWERVMPDYEVHRGDFPFLCVEFVEAGRGAVELNGDAYPLHAGVAFAYGPGVRHRIRTDAKHPLRKWYVDFTGTRGEELLAAGPLGHWKAVQLAEAFEFRDLFALLQREGTSGTPESSAVCAALVAVVLHKLIAKGVPTGGRESQALANYQRAKQHLQSQYLSIRTIEEVAAALHVTPAYLTRLFKRFDRTSPYQYLQSLKMSHAAALLLRSDRPIKSIARTLGFADAFHFSRVFKNVYGVSPSRFVSQATGRP